MLAAMQAMRGDIRQRRWVGGFDARYCVPTGGTFLIFNTTSVQYYIFNSSNEYTRRLGTIFILPFQHPFTIYPIFQPLFTLFHYPVLRFISRSARLNLCPSGDSGAVCAARVLVFALLSGHACRPHRATSPPSERVARLSGSCAQPAQSEQRVGFWNSKCTLRGVKSRGMGCVHWLGNAINGCDTT